MTEIILLYVKGQYKSRFFTVHVLYLNTLHVQANIFAIHLQVIEHFHSATIKNISLLIKNCHISQLLIVFVGCKYYEIDTENIVKLVMR
jgi:hypothetical protein